MRFVYIPRELIARFAMGRIQLIAALLFFLVGSLVALMFLPLVVVFTLLRILLKNVPVHTGTALGLTLTCAIASKRPVFVIATLGLISFCWAIAALSSFVETFVAERR